MLYQAYQTYADASEPMRFMARTAMAYTNMMPGFKALGFGREISATLEMISRTELTHTRPSYDIDRVKVGRERIRRPGRNDSVSTIL